MSNVPSQAVFFYFHTHLASHRSSFSLHPRYITPPNITSKMNFLFMFMTYPVFLFIFLFLSISQYLHNISSKKRFMYGSAIVLLLPLSLIFMTNFVFLKYSLRKLFFISLSLILLYSEVPRYLYPFPSTFLFLSPLDIYIPSDDTVFPLFNMNIPDSFIPNLIPILLLSICTMETNPFLFANIFKSSINKRWFNFSSFFKAFFDSVFLISKSAVTYDS